MSRSRIILIRRCLLAAVAASALAAAGAGCPQGGTVSCGGEVQTFDAGAPITLDGTGSFDPEGRQLTFRWEQTLGTPVDLMDADQAVARFIAPNVDETLTFLLTVSDTLGFSDSCEVSVRIRSVCDLLADAGEDQAVNVYEAVNLAGSATCGFPPYSFAWSQLSGPVQGLADADSQTTTVTGLIPGTSVFRLVVTDSAGTIATDDVTVEVICHVPTVITTQPTDQTVCEGDNVSFSVQATGLDDLTYQWRRGTADLTDGGRYAGTTTPTLTIAAAEQSDAAQDYNVVVTALCGSVTSNNVILTVLQDLTITQQPVDQFPSEGSAVFNVAATGAGPLTYQWQRNGVDLADVSERFAGTTTPSLTVTGSGSDVEGNYRVIVTGQCGSATSNEAVLVAPG